MNLEEAIKEYAIDIPTDEEFYNKEYQEYFKSNKRNGEFEKYRAFQEMYAKSFYATFYTPDFESYGKSLSTTNSEAVVLGGQAGAGKSSLSHIAKKEFHDKGKEIFVIDDDMYRLFYPRAEEILEKCPEFFTLITAIGSGPVTPKILKYASDNHLNFIFDGTMKNDRIINTSKGWDGYLVNWKIMATPKIESLLSIFERNEALRQLGQGRMISVDVHDSIYNGIDPTLALLESIPEIGHIQVYSRGKDCFNPILQYDSEQKGMYPNAVSALRKVRANETRNYQESDIMARIEKLKNTNIPLNEAELEKLQGLEVAVQEELRKILQEKDLDEER